jgi:DNA repair exonuclease SbcCD ATPase subunit
MKIIRLYSENVKRLRAVEILPKSNIVEIAGNNAQGKSSILDSIVYVLGGKDKIPSKPIREGEKKAAIILETEEYNITRNWTSDEKSYLKITTREGLQAQSPQTMLDGIVGKISFDPLEFIRMDSKEQDKLLREMVGLDTTELEQDKAKLYEMRRMVGREVQRLKVFRQELGNPQYGLPSEEVSSDEILSRLDEILIRNKEKETHQQNLNNQKVSLQGLDKDIQHYEEKVKELQATLERFKSARLAKQVEVNKLLLGTVLFLSVVLGVAVVTILLR